MIKELRIWIGAFEWGAARGCFLRKGKGAAKDSSWYSILLMKIYSENIAVTIRVGEKSCEHEKP
jgi:hypothetical protein